MSVTFRAKKAEKVEVTNKISLATIKGYTANYNECKMFVFVSENNGGRLFTIKPNTELKESKVCRSDVAIVKLPASYNTVYGDYGIIIDKAVYNDSKFHIGKNKEVLALISLCNKEVFGMEGSYADYLSGGFPTDNEHRKAVIETAAEYGYRATRNALDTHTDRMMSGAKQPIKALRKDFKKSAGCYTEAQPQLNAAGRTSAEQEAYDEVSRMFANAATC